jgi:hypothetical protein
LHCEALGEQAHQACELGNTDDLLVSDVSHVRLPVKWQCMVLTEPKKLDQPLNHLTQAAVRFTTAFGVKHREQFGVGIVALGSIKQGISIVLFSSSLSLLYHIYQQSQYFA